MSTLDRAFIRAYEIDGRDEPSPSPRGGNRHTGATPGPAFVQRETTRPGVPQVTSGLTAAPHFHPPHDPLAAPQRRPLSVFAHQAPQVDARFKPAMEVDAFRWSDVCEQLYQTSKPNWQTAVAALLAADDGGRSLIGVGGPTGGEGSTTVLQCLARLLVEAGKTVAIVDGDFSHAAVARSLGLAVEIGWEDVLAGRVPLAEGIIYSLADGLALLPLVQGGVPAAEKLDGIHSSVTAGVLRYHYDIVLFDLGAIGDDLQGPVARRIARQCRLDGFVLTTAGSARAAASPQWLRDDAPELAAVCLGVIENRSRAA